VRDVVLSEFVLAAVRRQTQEWPTFERVFRRAIVWRLERMPHIDSVPIPETTPQAFAIVSTAWKREGIPRLRLTYVEIPNGIELRSLAIWA
jgi:hypothetical protein